MMVECWLKQAKMTTLTLCHSREELVEKEDEEEDEEEEQDKKEA